MIRRNPQLPSWHPRHDIHLRHIDFNAQLLARRLSLMDVDDFLIATAEFTPQWSEMMLEEILRPRRRAQIEKSLAKRAKKYVNEWEVKLLTWNVDADTILDTGALIDEAAERITYQRNQKAKVSPYDAVITPVSPYLEVQWGFSPEDERAAADFAPPLMALELAYRSPDDLQEDVQLEQATSMLQVKFAEPLDRFFSDTLYAGELADRGFGPNAWRTTATRNYRGGRLASIFGSDYQRAEYKNSRPYIEKIDTTSFSGAEQKLIIAYAAAQEELARATLMATLFYLIILHSGDIPRETRQEGIRRVRDAGHSEKMGDMTISDIAAYYTAVFGVT